MEIKEILCAKDTKQGYGLFLQLEAQAGETDELYACFPLFLDMLTSPSSYIRTRGFRMICAVSKWDDKARIEKNLTEILAVLNDEKPTAVRQCLAALPGMLKHKPELADAIRAKLYSLDLAGYKDSMRPLICRDIEKLLQMLE